ncbi:MAG: acyl-CoA dehydrogenase family protein [Mycobacterium sp.]
MTGFDALCAGEPELAELRAQVRAFIADDRAQFGWSPQVDAWLCGPDPAFSARLGDAGYLGLTIPTEYGGHGLGHLHRYVVTEELLISGAPVSAHWFADRQVAPGLLTYGSEEQRRQILPQIASGRFYSAIGMSEPQSGSDLAAASTRATKTDDGWVLNGHKVWTSGAHLAHQIVVLARTSPADPEHRHAGFSQFLVPTDTAGVTIDPIVTMDGAHHFNEVVFTDAVVPEDALLGGVGDGWHQVTAELSFERSGPERILSTAPLLLPLLRALVGRADIDDGTAGVVGHLVARLVSLRQLSVSVARALAAGEPAANQAALVKDLGTRFEQDSVELAADLLDFVHDDDSRAELAALLRAARLHAPMFTLRGGTNEVLRGVIAKGMGLR